MTSTRVALAALRIALSWFKNGGKPTYIVAIKNIFSQTSSISKDVAVGVAINVIPKILGYS